MKPERLTGYQTAHFKEASKLRVRLFFVQLFLALPAAASVVVQDGKAVYWLAVVGAILSIVWWVLQAKYRRYREAAQSARRAGLIANGLGTSFSPAEFRDLRQKFVVTEDAAIASEDENYYASTLPCGFGRLAELIEESAFYTSKLQSISAFWMRVIVAGFAALFAVLAFGWLPYSGADTMMTIVRIGFAFLVFVLSTDVFGAMLAHAQAARDAKEIYQRLGRARSDKFPQSDVLLALSDYNAIIEAAPESIPFAYDLSRVDLDKKWREYQTDCLSEEELKK